MPSSEVATLEDPQVFPAIEAAFAVTCESPAGRAVSIAGCLEAAARWWPPSSLFGGDCHSGPDGNQAMPVRCGWAQ